MLCKLVLFIARLWPKDMLYYIFYIFLSMERGATITGISPENKRVSQRA